MHSGASKRVLTFSKNRKIKCLSGAVVRRGDLVVVPVGRLVADWPARVTNWVDQPWRWATPLELLVTLAMALIAYGVARSALSARRR